jgi:hypothetical protein
MKRLTITIKLNQLETELKEIKRKKRNDLNFYDFSNCIYYDNQILEIEKKIKELIGSQNTNIQPGKKEKKITKIYYKDIELSKRDYNIINNKKIYKPLYIYIYQKDVIAMLDDMYKFYSKRRHEIYNLFKGDKKALEKDKEFIQICDHKNAVSTIKSWINFGTYKNFIIKFDKDERPSRDDYTEILFYLSIDGYIPHIDTLEII